MADKIVAGDMFEKASRKKVRFTFRGVQSVESLWDLSLEDLDFIYKDLFLKKKTTVQESLLNTRSSDDEYLDLQIDIIKYIVQVKMEEQDKKLKRAENRKQLQKLLAIKSEAEEAKLKSMSAEELDKLIDKLQGDME
jgi:hypothetical protein